MFFNIQGAYAEYTIAPQKNLMRKPTHLSWPEAASIPENYLTGKSFLLRITQRTL
jgi:NADPH:quinone reductase-like Zn-dependent oxidoreductase